MRGRAAVATEITLCHKHLFCSVTAIFWSSFFLQHYESERASALIAFLSLSLSLLFAITQQNIRCVFDND